MKQLSLFSCCVFLSNAAFAHPSSEHHFGFVQGIRHLLSQPDHLLMLLAGFMLFWFIKKQITAQRRSKQKSRD